MAAPADQVVAHLLTLLPPLELLRIVELDEASRLSGLSRDSLTRDHAAKLIHLSRRRLGMRVCNALMINEVPAPT
jgi:hypothetical protein